MAEEQGGRGRSEQVRPAPGERLDRMSPRPVLPWSAVLGIACGGALLLAFFVAQSGSPVAMIVALLAGCVLGIAALIARRGQRRGAQRARPPLARAPKTAPPKSSPPVTPIQPTTLGASGHPGSPPHSQGDRPATSVPPPDPPRLIPDPPSVSDWRLPDAPPPQVPSDAPGAAGQPGAAGTPGEAGTRTEAVALALAMAAIEQLGAPASAVLVRRGRVLAAAASAGDWAAARRALNSEADDHRGPRPSGLDEYVGPNGPASDSGEPPQFAIDEHLVELMGLYRKTVPIERWQTLEEVPGPLLPLMALGITGAGVVVPLEHRWQFAGLWVLARRPGGALYSDADLSGMERLARAHGKHLAAALATDQRSQV